MPKYEISQELANAILSYLIERPYKETYILIEELRKLKPIEDNTSNTEKI